MIIEGTETINRDTWVEQVFLFTNGQNRVIIIK